MLGRTSRSPRYPAKMRDGVHDTAWFAETAGDACGAAPAPHGELASGNVSLVRIQTKNQCESPAGGWI